MTRNPALFCLALALCAGFFFSPPHTATAQQRDGESPVIDNQRLLQTPQVYWSRPILFKDTLVSAPGGQSIRLDDVRYVAFETAELGTCYATADIQDSFAGGEGQEFAFNGTVLSRKRGLPFFRRTEFLIIANRAAQVKPADAGSLAEGLEALIADPEAAKLEPSLAVVIALYEGLQASAIAYAQENNLELEYVLAPGSEHLEKINDLLRRQLRSLELQNATTAQTVLADFVRILLAQKHRNPPEVNSKSTSDEPEPGPMDGPLPEEQPELEEAPPEADEETPVETLNEQDPMDSMDDRPRPLVTPPPPATTPAPEIQQADIEPRKPGFFERRRIRKAEEAARRAQEKSEKEAPRKPDGEPGLDEPIRL